MNLQGVGQSDYRRDPALTLLSGSTTVPLHFCTFLQNQVTADSLPPTLHHMPLNILQEIIDEILDGTAVSTFVSITPDHPRGTLLDYTSFSKGWAH